MNMRITEKDFYNLYKGEDYKINDKIIIKQPNMKEIIEYGFDNFFSMVSILCSTPNDDNNIYWLTEAGYDFTKIEEFDLFCILCQQFDKERTNILFENLDFTKFELQELRNKDDDKLVSKFLYNDQDDIVIDKKIYLQITEILRMIYGLKKNMFYPANARAKQDFIDDAYDKHEALMVQSLNREGNSWFNSFISFLVSNADIKENRNTIWDASFFYCRDVYYRVLHNKQVDLLKQSGYSGFGIDISKINKSNLDYTKDLYITE